MIPTRHPGDYSLTMATIMTIHNASCMHIETRFAKPVDDVQHAYVVFDLEDDTAEAHSRKRVKNSRRIWIPRRWWKMTFDDTFSHAPLSIRF